MKLDEHKPDLLEVRQKNADLLLGMGKTSLVGAGIMKVAEALIDQHLPEETGLAAFLGVGAVAMGLASGFFIAYGALEAWRNRTLKPRT